MFLYLGIAAATVVVILQIGILRSISSLLRKTRHLEERANRSGELFTLLTEACSSGFTNMAQELTRVADQAPIPARPRVSARRLTQAVNRGESIDQIAAAERLAEGEVRLRLFLENAKLAPGRKGRANGSLRAS